MLDSEYCYYFVSKFPKLKHKLQKYEGDAAYGICEDLYYDLTCALEFWCPEQNALRKNVKLTSPRAMLIIQEFLTSYGMHLERINPEDCENRIFKIMPNW